MVDDGDSDSNRRQVKQSTGARRSRRLGHPLGLSATRALTNAASALRLMDLLTDSGLHAQLIMQL